MNEKTMYWTTKEAAEKFLEMTGKEKYTNGRTFYLPKGIYYLRHGEYAKPNYIIRKTKKGYKIKIIYKYYYNTYNAPKDHDLTEIEVACEEANK